MKLRKASALQSCNYRSQGVSTLKNMPNRAHLKRLNQATDFLAIMRLMLWLPLIDTLLFLGIALGLILPFTTAWGPLITIITIGLMTSLWYLTSYELIYLILNKNRMVKLSHHFTYFFRSILYLIMPLILLSYLMKENHNLLIINSLFSTLPFVILLSPVSTYLAVSIGYYTSKRWWSLTPIWLPFYLLTHAHTIIKYLKQTLIRGHIVVLLITTTILDVFQRDSMVATISPFLRFFTLLSFPTSKNINITYIPDIILYVFSLLLVSIAIISISLASIVLKQVYIMICEKHKEIVWKVKIPKVFTHIDLYQALTGYYLAPTIQNELLRFARRERLLTPTPETIALLRDITIEAEIALQKRNAYWKAKQKPNTILNDIKQFVSRIKKMRKIIRKGIFSKKSYYDALTKYADDTTIDELYMLIKDLSEAQRQDHISNRMGSNKK